MGPAHHVDGGRSEGLPAVVKKLTGPIAAALLVIPSVSTAATRDDADSAINAAANQITNQIVAAKASNDQVKLSCLNDSLSKVNALRSSADFDGAIAQAAAFKDEASSCVGASDAGDDETSAEKDDAKQDGSGKNTAEVDATDPGTASSAVGNAANSGSSSASAAGADAAPAGVQPPGRQSAASPVF